MTLVSRAIHRLLRKMLMSSKGDDNVAILTRDTIMLQHVIMHFSLHYLSGGRLWEVENKQNLIFNNITQNLRRNQSVIITKRRAR